MTNAVENTTRSIIQEGSTGQDVADLQTVLSIGANPVLVIDGVFGAKTKEAVIAFQNQNNLTPDGIVGPKTWAIIDSIETFEGEPGNLPTLRRGDTGKDVEFLQKRLNIWGTSLVVDGIFGAATEETVKKFQAQYNLTVDGIVGTQTWTKLLTVED
ncbi:MAG: peptidoglycan-binding protein [Cyanobacteria bacterium J06633_8]